MSSNLVLGSAVHAALAGYYLALINGDVIVADELVQIFVDDWDGEVATLPNLLLPDGVEADDLKDQGVGLVRAFLDGVPPVDESARRGAALRARHRRPQKLARCWKSSSSARSTRSSFRTASVRCWSTRRRLGVGLPSMSAGICKPVSTSPSRTLTGSASKCWSRIGRL